ncbi:hypothetical protein CBR_g313 [Chara braunii]|uniref:Uncharacterized protein n=1 Tax=Chara braunii TaxID=69332 RepID=A0A388JQE6_CHABU|nr:hypothetical protein CBR_g313 [Chara braunii]|eukprot:GBG59983.1 hypothetical protein CBR_g313 [Chara braunii]
MSTMTGIIPSGNDNDFGSTAPRIPWSYVFLRQYLRRFNMTVVESLPLQPSTAQGTGGSLLCGIVALPSPDARIAVVAVAAAARCVLVGSRAVVATANGGSVRSAVGTTPFVDVVGGGTAPAVLAGGNGVGPRIAPSAVPARAPACVCFAEMTPAGFVDFVVAASLHRVVVVAGAGSMPGVAFAVVADDAASLGAEHSIVVTPRVIVVAAFAAARAGEARFVVALSVVAELVVVDVAFGALATGAAHFVDVPAVVVATFVPVVPTAGVAVTTLAGPAAVAPAVAAFASASASAPLVFQAAVMA